MGAFHSAMLIEHAFGGYYNCSFLYVLVEICCIGYELKARRQFSPIAANPCPRHRQHATSRRDKSMPNPPADTGLAMTSHRFFYARI